MSFYQGSVKVMTVVGTGAVINVELGYVPRYVRIINQNTLGVLEWFDDMTDGHAIKQIAAGTITAITSNGISKYQGAEGSAAKGFTIGTDATNGSGNNLRVLVIGGED